MPPKKRAKVLPPRTPISAHDALTLWKDFVNNEDDAPWRPAVGWPPIIKNYDKPGGRKMTVKDVRDTLDTSPWAMVETEYEDSGAHYTAVRKKDPKVKQLEFEMFDPAYQSTRTGWVYRPFGPLVQKIQMKEYRGSIQKHRPDSFCQTYALECCVTNATPTTPSLRLFIQGEVQKLENWSQRTGFSLDTDVENFCINDFPPPENLLESPEIRTWAEVRDKLLTLTEAEFQAFIAETPL